MTLDTIPTIRSIDDYLSFDARRNHDGTITPGDACLIIGCDIDELRMLIDGRDVSVGSELVWEADDPEIVEIIRHIDGDVSQWPFDEHGRPVGRKCPK